MQRYNLLRLQRNIEVYPYTPGESGFYRPYNYKAEIVGLGDVKVTSVDTIQTKDGLERCLLTLSNFSDSFGLLTRVYAYDHIFIFAIGLFSRAKVEKRCAFACFSSLGPTGRLILSRTLTLQPHINSNIFLIFAP